MNIPVDLVARKEVSSSSLVGRALDPKWVNLKNQGLNLPREGEIWGRDRSLLLVIF
jgi:hypothetical protein